MLTGDVEVTQGDAYLDGYSIRRNLKAVSLSAVVIDYSHVHLIRPRFVANVAIGSHHAMKCAWSMCLSIAVLSPPPTILWIFPWAFLWNVFLLFLSLSLSLSPLFFFVFLLFLEFIFFVLLFLILVPFSFFPIKYSAFFLISTSFLIRTDCRLSFVQVQRRLGYCPQFDAIIEEMTGRETLWMFANLRGIPRRSINAVIDDLTHKLLLGDHINKQVKQMRYVHTDKQTDRQTDRQTVGQTDPHKYGMLMWLQNRCNVSIITAVGTNGSWARQWHWLAILASSS